jgi:hypothetical protein
MIVWFLTFVALKTKKHVSYLNITIGGTKVSTSEILSEVAASALPLKTFAYQT